MIEHVWCVSLEKDKMRRALMEPQLNKYFENKHTFINAYTPEDEIVKNAFNTLLPENRFTAMSQIAICYSHLKCVQEIYDRQLLFGGIIEDDIHIIDNYNTIISKHIENSPDVMEIMRTEPCIIHLISSPTHNEKIYKFVKKPVVSNICFYVINHMMAKIILDNAIPLLMSFDQYIHKLVPKHNIQEYVACPILGWDLSTSLYTKLHTNEDREYKKYIKNESNNMRFTKKN